MLEIFNFVTQKGGHILEVATTTVTAASLLANLTPTRKDDRAVSRVAKVVNFLALNWRKR